MFISHLSFFSFFSNLFPLSGFFFLIKIIDLSKDYKPTSKIVLDIPTALNFFHLNPAMTKQKVGEEVRKLVKSWNAEYAEKANVSRGFFLLCKAVVNYYCC